MGMDLGIARRQGLELVGGAHQGQAGLLCQGLGHRLGEAGGAVQTGTDRGAPQCQLTQMGQGGIQVAHSFTALLIALVLYTAAFIAEIVRAGILAISRGQSEAAFALGMRPTWTMNLIILPQALRVIIPPLISQYLNLTKNTSLGIAVSYLDLRGTLGGITLNQTGRELECMLLMMAIYLTISLIISSLMNFYNSSVQLKAR